MELKELILLPAGIRFSEVVQEPYADMFLSPWVYKVDKGIYLNISSFRPGSLAEDPHESFVYGIIIAGSDGAVRRAWLRDIESDDGKTMNIPAEFLPFGGAVEVTYGEILRGLKEKKPESLLETASYRIATDGRFIHRKIETEHFAFYFRKEKHDDSEPPYVILRKLT